jgi:hypothetical protein
MQEIIIDGVNLNELKAKHDALQKEMSDACGKIRQGASKFIAENISAARKVLDEMLELDSEEDVDKIDNLAQNAHDILSATSFVSDVSGVPFEIPYYDRQAEYYPDSTPYSNQLEDAGFDTDRTNKLYFLLESMESEVSDWNASYC